MKTRMAVVMMAGWVLAAASVAVAQTDAEKAGQVKALYEAGKAAVQAKDWATAGAKWEESLRIDPRNWEMLNHYAWFLVDTVPAEQKAPDKALPMAVLANELTGGKNRDVLDTLAEVWYQKKDYAKAVEFSRKSLEPGLEGHSKPHNLQKQLAKFEKALGESKPPAPAKP